MENHRIINITERIKKRGEEERSEKMKKILDKFIRHAEKLDW